MKPQISREMASNVNTIAFCGLYHPNNPLITNPFEGGRVLID